MHNLFRKYLTFIEKKLTQTGAQYKAFGLFGVLNFPLYYLIWLYISPQIYENFFLRAALTLLCCPLIFHEKWPNKLKPYLPFYWYLTLCISLPFFFTYMLIMTQGSFMWSMNTMLMVFLIELLVDWLVGMFLLLIGSCLGGMLGFFLADTPIFSSHFDYVGFFVTYGIALIISILFSHNRQAIEEAKLKTFQDIGALIAHELRTPLRSISSALTAMQTHYPDLVKTYQIAEHNHLSIPYISPLQASLLPKLLSHAHYETRAAFHIIDMLLIKANLSTLSTFKLEVCSMAKCVELALTRYPFQEGEAQLIDNQFAQDKSDFLFRGHSLLMIHVLFNLLKNALYYIQVSGKGSIQIGYKKGAFSHHLMFKDTGKGIPKQLLPKLFDQLFTHTPHGTGLGLFFCREVMKSFGATLNCEAEEGLFTCFFMRFPSVSFKKEDADDAHE